MSEQTATLSLINGSVRCTVLAEYGKSQLNYRVRFEEDCVLGKAGNTYIAPRRLLTFDNGPSKATPGGDDNG